MYEARTEVVLLPYFYQHVHRTLPGLAAYLNKTKSGWNGLVSVHEAPQRFVLYFDGTVARDHSDFDRFVDTETGALVMECPVEFRSLFYRPAEPTSNPILQAEFEAWYTQYRARLQAEQSPYLNPR